MATIRYAEEVGAEVYRDRQQAVANRDMAGDALDERAAGAVTGTFTSLCARYGPR